MKFVLSSLPLES